MKKITFVALFILSFLLPRQIPLYAEGKTLVGETCPELLLKDHMLQGNKITQKDFKGKVVFLEIFQRGCPGCEKVSLPHLQKMWKSFKDNPNCVIVALNTAFEKEQYPIMGDEDATKKHLEEMGWTFPVLRDADEKTVSLFKRDHRGRETFGTPMTIVIGPDGTILAHEWHSNETATDILETVFEKALLELELPKPREVAGEISPAVKLMAEKKMAEAWTFCKNALKEKKFGDAALTDAQYLIDLLETSIKERAQKAKDGYSYDPPSAHALGLKTLRPFEGIDSADDFFREMKRWEGKDDYRMFNELAGSLDNARRANQRAGACMTKAQADKVIEGLDLIVNMGVGTRVAEEAKEEIKAIRRSFEGPAFLGINIDPQFEGPGLKITVISSEGPAEKAELKVGDVLLKVNGEKVENIQALQKLIAGIQPLAELECEIQSDGGNKTIKVIAGRRIN